MNYEEILEKYKEEFLGKKDYYKEARQLISDIKYFNAHMTRTRISERFDFQIIIGFDGFIMNRFVREIFCNYLQSYWIQEEYMIQRLKIYDITYAIFNKIQYNEKHEYDINRKYIEKAIKWAPVLNYYTDINLKDYIGGFCGSSYSINQIKKIWDDIEEAIKKGD